MTQTTVNFIGTGRVGKTMLGLLKSRPEYVVQDIASSRLESAQEAVAFAGIGRAVAQIADLRPADIWIIAVPDAQIATVAHEIATEAADRVCRDTPPLAFHCSGFFAADQLAPLGRLGWHVASVHPVLTFADPELAVQQFKGAFCGIEGDDASLARVTPLINAMGAKAFPIKSDSKSLYHAAAVISNNFTVVLQGIARAAWAEAGVPDDIAEHLNRSLLKATYENVAAHGPLGALTGPASRGDDDVVARQGADVTNWDPSVGALYTDLSARAKKMKATHVLPND